MTWTTGVAYNLVIEQNLNNVEVYLDDNLLVSWDTAVYIPDTHEGEIFNLETGFPENWHNYDYDNVADAVLENIKYTQIGIDLNYCDVDNEERCQSCDAGFILSSFFGNCVKN